MKKLQSKLSKSISTLILAFLITAPIHAGTMIVAGGHITVDEDNLITNGTHTATIQDIDSVHLFEDWFLQGQLEKPSQTIVASCSDSGTVGATPELRCTTRKQYWNCDQAFGAQRGRTNSQVFVSQNSPHNLNATKRLGTRHMECSSQCFADNTNTIFLPLGKDSPSFPFKTGGFDHQLFRTKRFANERFVMDEWAVTGIAPKSSSDRFRDIVAAQFTQKTTGSYLVIQEPIHDLNAKWVPRPSIQMDDTTLADNYRGNGEIVAVRAEIFKGQHIEDVQVVYESKPIDQAWIENLVRERLSLKFSSHKEHPAVAFLVLRIGESLEVVDSRSILPKCCQCIAWPCT